VQLVLSLFIFVGFGLSFVLINLLVGKLVRPSLPSGEKAAIYECGEPTVGTSWVQFDLRFYIVALFYLVFDVEVALIYPWAVSFREYPGPALALGAPFIAVVIIGYAYEWYSGSLEWVRSAMNRPLETATGGEAELAELARRDPETVEEPAAHP